MTAEVLAAERDGGVLTLTLNRPEKLNSLDDTLVRALADAVQSLRSDASVRAVVLTGAGRGFCAGADLGQAALHGESVGEVVRRRLRTVYHPLITGLRSLEQPVIAAVNGVAAGAGMSLALAADLRIAAESASFIQAFVRIGLVPDAGSTWLLPRIVGPARAAELALLGDRVDAAEALRIGLVSRVVPDASLLVEAQAMAARLAEGPRSIGLIKHALALSPASDLDTQLAHEEDLQALAASTEDFAEGVAAFLEKRPARFRGR